MDIFFSYNKAKHAFKNMCYLDLQHAQCNLEEHHWALVEEQVPDSQQDAYVHHTGKCSEEPV